MKQFQLSEKIKNYIFLNKKIILLFFAVFICLFLYVGSFKSFFERDYSTVIKDKDGRILKIYTNSKEQYIYPVADFKVPEKLRICIISFEDKRFNSHIGVDFFALLRAAYKDIKNMSIVSGGSTITMQVARMLNPGARTFLKKFLEIIHALYLELLYSKQEILNMYVNNAPYGGNIIGVQMASYMYFGKPPHELTWGQAATLAVLPNAPSLITPYRKSDLLYEKRNRLLKKLHLNKIIDKNTFILSKEEKIPEKRYKIYDISPHFNEAVYNLNTGKESITSIDYIFQKKVRDISLYHSSVLKNKGINNLSMVVIENNNGKVRAYVGNPDFNDRENSSMVDGVQAQRSTGSVLKPFLYALSIQEGIISQNELLTDIPTMYSGYSPENYDRKYRGLIPASEMIIKSLNVPAVRLLKKYGYNKFYEFLKSAGMTTLFRESDQYGLTLILGGAEGKLIEMCNMYSMLASGGLLKKISFFQDEDVNEIKRLLEPGACFITLDTLKYVKRPDIDYYFSSFSGSSNISWKTGTSYGHKDAWAIGVNPDYTVGVWVGNFSGEGISEITGSKAAAPVLFDIFRILPESESFIRSDDVGIKDFCSFSGMPASEYCQETRKGYFLRTASDQKVCDKCVQVDVDKNEKYTVCSLCWDEDRKKISRLRLDEKVVSFYKDVGYSLNLVPEHNPDCMGNNNRKLSFIYPENNGNIFQPRGIQGDFQKISCKVAHSDHNSELFWYVNSEFVGKTSKNHTKDLNFIKGKNTITVVDSHGNRKSVTINVFLKNN